MKKVLFVASVVKKHINQFHIPFLKWFKDNGYETHVCARNDYENKEDCTIPYCDYYYDIPFNRSPLKMENIKAYKMLKEVITFSEFDIIHCHTPIGGVLTRIAARNVRKEKNTSVIYTAHGLHFYKGAPTKNWLMYYPVEKWLSKHTDTLILINEDDYNTVKRKKFKARNIELVNGVGIDLTKYKSVDQDEKSQLRRKYGYSDDDFILIYVGELTDRKNQGFLIDCVQRLTKQIPSLKLLLAGSGELADYYKRYAKEKDVQDNIDFLGYRNDVANLMNLSDVTVSSSKQEGLPVNIMEAMASGLPCVVTNCRGNRDLVSNDKNGFVFELTDVDGFTEGIRKLYLSPDLRKQFGNESTKGINGYSKDEITKQMLNVYKL